MPRGGTAIAIESGLQHYLRQINEVDLLTADEEKELARAISAAHAAAERFQRGEITLAQRERIEEAGVRARERMIRANLRLVVNIAKGYGRRGMPLSDLIEEGNLGLLRAVEGFDPDQGARFSTYAAWWIKQAIKRALINGVQPIHIPAYMVEMISRWKEAQRVLRERLGRTPSLGEMAEQMQLPERKVRIVRRAVRALSSASHSAEFASGLPITETLPDHRTPGPDASLALQSESTMLQDLLGQDPITQREATVLKLRYGLDGEPPMTLKDIGKRVGLTKERVRQIENEALNKLQALYNGEVPEPNGVKPPRGKRRPPSPTRGDGAGRGRALDA